MLFSENHPPGFDFVVCLIIVVMAGLGLSSGLNRRFGHSSKVMEIRREIAAGEWELERLETRHRQLSLTLTAVEPQLPMVDACKSMQREGIHLAQRRTSLAASRDVLEAAIAALEHEFADYRAKVRDHVWREAVGQQIGTLITRSGREYRQVSIRRVTAMGLEIRHQDGSARIPVADLSQTLHDRFAWDGEGHHGRLTE